MKKMSCKWAITIWLVAGAYCGACGQTGDPPKETSKIEASPGVESSWLTNFDAAEERARSERRKCY